MLFIIYSDTPDTFDPFASNSWIFFLIFGVIGIIFSLIIWKTSHKNMAPSYVWVFSLMAFIISIAWINMVANYLIDFLSVIYYSKFYFKNFCYKIIKFVWNYYIITNL